METACLVLGMNLVSQGLDFELAKRYLLWDQTVAEVAVGAVVWSL